jgi:hypothetical protein
LAISEVHMLSKRVDVLESGNVYFFFRPEVEEAAEKLEEAQRMFVVLAPEEPHRYRLLVIRRRSFSQESEIDRTSGFVDAVSGEPKCVEDRLAPEAHQRKITGESHLPALRPIGEGVYRIIRHDDHTHFAYVWSFLKLVGAHRPHSHLKIRQVTSSASKIPNKALGLPRICSSWQNFLNG